MGDCTPLLVLNFLCRASTSSGEVEFFSAHLTHQRTTRVSNPNRLSTFLTDSSFFYFQRMRFGKGFGDPPVSSERLISTFETGSRISVLQSRVARRDREFISFSLMLRDEIEIFFLSVSCFETRTGISLFQSCASRQAREFFNLISGFETRARNSFISSQFSRRELDFLAFS